MLPFPLDGWMDDGQSPQVTHNVKRTCMHRIVFTHTYMSIHIHTHALSTYTSVINKVFIVDHKLLQHPINVQCSYPNGVCWCLVSTFERSTHYSTNSILASCTNGNSYLRRRPASVARRFNESSDSQFWRTYPERAKVLCAPVITPLLSTSATLIWTAAWSLEPIRRPVAELYYTHMYISWELAAVC